MTKPGYLSSEAHNFLTRFRPASDIWNGHPVLYKQVMREKMRTASFTDLSTACRLCNCNVEGLMELLGL